MNINLTHSSYFYESVLFPCVKNFCKNKKTFSTEYYFQWNWLFSRVAKYYFETNIYPHLSLQNKSPFKNPFQFGYL